MVSMVVTTDGYYSLIPICTNERPRRFYDIVIIEDSIEALDVIMSSLLNE